ncbi:MAG: flagellar biosynthesis protein FlhA [Deltaproteobacteria bacterium]|jgi:flagellar biosynthesis protein FlhA|nr:flagellar biosynthesis protein FlhA [Deltaproteobacteria bacterium]
MKADSAPSPLSFGKILTPEIVVGASFLAVVSLLVVPVPPLALDLLLALSFAISAVVFLTAMFSERPTDFSIFPTLLLISTLLRLSLNIASTRLILLHGHEGPDAAGEIIEAFSQFVVGGNVGVGMVIFLALIVINFVVITKGAGRIAEVAARFTLDAMPGKQMAIDAELSSGAINEKEARTRRAEVEQQADFYGAMDGSNKFIRGDAIAALIITGINLVGGIAIGVIQHGLSAGQAATNYSMLTMGDGLVSQMPALVVSTAAGLAITRASGKSDFGAQVVSQLLSMRRVLVIAAGFLLFIGLLPGLPFFPFAVLAGALLFVAWRQGKEVIAPVVEEAPVDPNAEPTMGEVLHVDPLVLEVGYGLLALVDASRGGDVPERVKKLRKQLAQDLGLVIPPVRVVDNLQLAPTAYVIKLYGVEVAKGQLQPDRHLAIDSTGASVFPGGVETKEPVFGLRAYWISGDDRARAEAKGLTVVDPSTVLSTHLAEVLRRNADQLLGRDQAHELIGYVRQEAPKLIEELVPGQLGMGEVVGVLKNLLAERVSIRNLRAILEGVAGVAGRTKDLGELTEAARTAIGRQITSGAADGDGVLHALVFDREMEHLLRGSIAPNGSLAPDPSVFQALIRQTADIAASTGAGKQTPVLLVADDLRRPVRELVSVQLPDIPVIAVRELDRQLELKVVGTVTAKASR